MNLNLSSPSQTTDCVRVPRGLLRGRDKMAANFLATFSNAFSWMKIYKFRIRFPWNLFLMVQLTTFHNIVVNDYTLSYTDLLHTTKRCPLYVSRLKSMATEMFKSMTHNSPTFIENLFTMSDTPYDLRGGKSIIQPSVETTTFGLKSFRYEGAKLWNNLPSEMKCASSLKDFKVLVKQWTGPSCHCRSCVLCDIDQLWAALGYTC